MHHKKEKGPLHNFETTHMVLTEHASQITPREENRPAPIPTLHARFLSKMRRNHIDLDFLRANQTMSRFLIAIDITQSWTQIAVGEMGVGERALLGCVDGGKEVVAGYIGVEEKGRRNMDGASLSYYSSAYGVQARLRESTHERGECC